MTIPSIVRQIELKASGDGNFAVAYALLQVADRLADLAVQVKYLGNGDAATQMGAIENLAKEVKEGSSAIAGALNQMAEYLGNPRPSEAPEITVPEP